MKKVVPFIGLIERGDDDKVTAVKKVLK